MTRPLADSETTVREAALRCIAEGVYPSMDALRRHGARGGNVIICRTLDDLITRRVVILPPTMASRRKGGMTRRAATITPIRIPKPFNPDPCAAEVRDYRASWRRITRRPSCRSCT